MSADAPPIAADDSWAEFPLRSSADSMIDEDPFPGHGFSAAIGGASALIGVHRLIPAQRERMTERRME